MPRASTKRSDRAPAGEGRGDHFDLLRYSHIFASAVRDLLEVKVLREVTADPLSLPQFHLLKLIAVNGRHHVGEVALSLGVIAPADTNNNDKREV